MSWVAPRQAALLRRSWTDHLLEPRALLVLAVLGMLCVLCLFALDAMAQGQPVQERVPVWRAVLNWTPLILLGPPGNLGGFALNVLISALAMLVGTFAGVLLGVLQLARSRYLRLPAWAVTQFFRNSPWLVLLFFVMLLMPFELRFGGARIAVPDWLKAVFGLALPVMANLSEVTRGAIQSIPSGQRESADALGLSARQTALHVILPQCVKRMTPPWMNWYALVTMATPLVSIVGVNDAVTLTRDALAAAGRTDLLIPMYLWLLVWFAAYCYPIALLTQRLERRFALAG
jgi:polar amino acid transport system permease protein